MVRIGYFAGPVAALARRARRRPARAFIAYVSNEKGNTVSVIDTDKLEAVEDHQGRPAAARHRGHPGRQIRAGRGRRRRHDPDDRHQDQARSWTPCPPVPIPSCSPRIPPARSSTSPTRTTTRSRSSTSRSARASATSRSASSPRAWRVSPDGKILVNTSETTNMAHFIDTATRQIVANVLVDSRPRFAEFKRDGSELWVSSEIGGTVSDHRSRQARRDRQDRASRSRGCGAEAIQPVGIDITKDGKTGLRRARPRQPRRRGRWHDPRR